MKNEKTKIIIAYTLVILWMIAIFLLSNMDGPSSLTTSKMIIYNVVDKIDQGTVNIGINKKPLSNEKKQEIVKQLHYPLRKLMHFSEYLILALLLLNALSLSKVKNKYLICIIIFFLYASLDEFHQTLVNNRTGQILDVFIDSSGGLVGCFIRKLYERKKH